MCKQFEEELFGIEINRMEWEKKISKSINTVAAGASPEKMCWQRNKFAN